MSQELAIFRQPDIELDFADCEEYINIPVAPFTVGKAYVLDDEGNKCYIGNECIDNVRFLISLPTGVEYDSSLLSIGTYEESTESILVDSMCAEDIFQATIKVKATSDCVYPFKVGITMTDDGECLTYEKTQTTLVTAKQTCKQITSCLNTVLKCKKDII